MIYLFEGARRSQSICVTRQSLGTRDEGRSEAEPLDMRYQAEPGKEGRGKERGGASGYALPGRAWERGKRGKERGGASGYALPGRAWERGNGGYLKNQDLITS